MIRRVFANQASFRTVRLEPGFNVILADQTTDSTAKDSRNGLGKSTLLEIVHFCLGGDGAALKADRLSDWRFGIDLVLGGREVTVERAIRDPRRVFLRGDTNGLAIELMQDSRNHAPSLDVKDWNAALGNRMFGLPVQEHKVTHVPTFRSLISYFARRGRDAFSRPFTHFGRQQEWDKQVNVAFLLQLAWEDARETQLLKDKATALSGLKKAVKAGLIDRYQGKRADLENLRIRLEAKVRDDAARLGAFRVHTQYRELQEKAGALTKAIHDLANASYESRQLLALYQRDASTEAPSDDAEVERLYEEAGVSLGAAVRRRLEEVKRFHHTVVAHRREFLGAEVSRLQRVLGENEKAVGELTEQRAEYLTVLQTHGALEEYTQLQQIHLRAVEEVNRVKGLLDSMNKLESGTSTIKIEQEVLYQKARRDYEDRSDVRTKAANFFNENSEYLYAAPGRLLVDLSKTGFRFNVEIERKGSDGIDNMTIFCFDLMLAQLWSERRPTPGFLWHDSRIFEADARQRALALHLAARESSRRGFQYICTLNSDAVPVSEFPEGFSLDPFIRLRLTDTRPEGSLLGIRF
jgi:uncharacterized protein YydD (DUF2326 family)